MTCACTLLFPTWIECLIGHGRSISEWFCRKQLPRVKLWVFQRASFIIAKLKEEMWASNLNERWVRLGDESIENVWQTIPLKESNTLSRDRKVSLPVVDPTKSCLTYECLVEWYSVFNCVLVKEWRPCFHWTTMRGNVLWRQVIAEIALGCWLSNHERFRSLPNYWHNPL
jgi:hypothetical protein